MSNVTILNIYQTIPSLKSYNLNKQAAFRPISHKWVNCFVPFFDIPVS